MIKYNYTCFCNYFLQFYKKSHNVKYLKRIIHRNVQRNIGKNIEIRSNPQKEIQQGALTSTVAVEYPKYIALEGETLNSCVPSENSLEIHMPNNQCNTLLASDNSELSLERFKEHLRCWAIGYHIAQTAVSDLLKIMKSDLKINSLPSDARTLFKTNDINYKILNLPPGKYYHFGLKSKLLLKLIQNDFEGDEVNISVNIDGLPLTKSSGSQFWPILVKIDELKNKPFPIGVYHGKSKPNNSNVFLSRFVEEMKILQSEGLCLHDKTVKIKISKIVCDAPAKSFLLCIKNFNSYSSCTKCYAEGSFKKNRMTFPELNSELRTNEEFYSQTDNEYHKETSLLCDLKIDFTKRIPLDYMHLVLLGVMKRLLGFWIKGNQEVRLLKQDIELNNEKLKLIYKSIPYEITRKPRLITEYEMWKGVEFRTFLLYYGPWLMKPFLKNHYFLHFLSLHCAIRILVCHDLLEKYIDYANELLRYFVAEFGDLYGQEYVNHNIHNLTHLTLDVNIFGPLDKFSCFPFENYMHSIKMMLKTSNKPLSQFIRRVYEFETYSASTVEQKLFLKEDGLRLINNEKAEGFSAMSYQNYRIETKEPNCNFVLKSNEPIKVVDILRINNIYYIKYKKYKLISYFDNPMDSSIFWCGFVETMDEEHIISADNILRKAFKIENCFLTMLHSN